MYESTEQWFRRFLVPTVTDRRAPTWATRSARSAGRQRLQAMASILKQASASQVLVRVAPQPGGISLATQRAEAILHALRQDGIPDRVLALATGSGLTPGTAELLLVGQAAP